MGDPVRVANREHTKIKPVNLNVNLVVAAQTLPEIKNRVWPMAKLINKILCISKKQVDSAPMELVTTTSQLSRIVKMLLDESDGLIQ
tara:strand:- start:231 stop:491 length:261 start_codon:yes stop_codon:yes gene_type:complete